MRVRIAILTRAVVEEMPDRIDAGIPDIGIAIEVIRLVERGGDRIVDLSISRL